MLHFPQFLKFATNVILIKIIFPLNHMYSRIISLVPSQTELLYYLGLEKEVVGITKFCIHPKEWFKIKQELAEQKMINFDIQQPFA